MGKVVGTVISTRKEDELAGLKFLLVKACDADGKPTGGTVVAVDAVGAGVGEVVLYASGCSARQTKVTKDRPVDATIMAIVDQIEIEGDRALPESAVEVIDATARRKADPGDRREGDGAPRRRAICRRRRWRRSIARSSRRCRCRRRRRTGSRCPTRSSTRTSASDGAARHLPRRRLGGEGGAQGVRAVRPHADRSAQQDDRGDARHARCEHVRELAEYAVAETGLGRVDDKIKKNTLVATKTPGTEILRPITYSGDYGLMVTERAPYGVFGAITPTTNPTETIICNGIGMLAGGNAVVFNTHPSAARVCGWHGAPAQRGDRRRGRAGESAVRRRRADHRERAGADEASAHPHPRRHRRAGRRQRGDELGQARHRRRPGQSARGRRRDGAPRRRRQGHHRRRVDRQQHHLHRREGSAGGGVDRRSLEGAAGRARAATS